MLRYKGRNRVWIDLILQFESVNSGETIKWNSDYERHSDILYEDDDIVLVSWYDGDEGGRRIIFVSRDTYEGASVRHIVCDFDCKTFDVYRDGKVVNYNA